MAEVEHIEDPSPPDLLRSRRWFGRVGLGMIGGIAGLLASAEPAAADGYHYGCCHLANPHDYSAGPCNSTSAPYEGRGYAWHCCHGGRLMKCVECRDERYPTPSECFNGAFIRSYGQLVGWQC